MSGVIPVIDFAVFGLGVPDPDSVSEEQLKPVSESVYKALSTLGFCYLTNHGVDEKLVSLAIVLI
jgi:hypothetical protein